MTRYLLVFSWILFSLMACPPPSAPPTSNTPAPNPRTPSVQQAPQRVITGTPHHAKATSQPASAAKNPSSRKTRSSSHQALQQAKRLQKQWMNTGGRQSRAINPVYNDSQYQVHPLAKTLCTGLHTLPAQRKAQCCGEKNLGYLVTQECERNLSIALKIGGISLDPQHVSRCIADLNNTYQGCHWVGMWQPPLPSSCRHLIQGKLPLNAPCRSNLECREGLHCFGLGTTNIGRCYPPLPEGSRCGAGVDALATFTRQEDVYTHHPMCKHGYCKMYRCFTFNKPGTACRSSIQCGPGHYCNGSICIQGSNVPPGSPCSGRCSPGFRCLQGKCAPIKKAGETCTSDLECEGGCIPVRGTNMKLRRCGMRCKSPLFDHWQ